MRYNFNLKLNKKEIKKKKNNKLLLYKIIKMYQRLYNNNYIQPNGTIIDNWNDEESFRQRTRTSRLTPNKNFLKKYIDYENIIPKPREESFKRTINEDNGFYNYNTEGNFKNYDKRYIEGIRESQLNKYLDEKIERLKKIKNSLRPQRFIETKNINTFNNKSTIIPQKYSFDNYSLCNENDRFTFTNYQQDKSKRISEDKKIYIDQKLNNKNNRNNIINGNGGTYPKYIYNMNTIQNNINNNNFNNNNNYKYNNLNNNTKNNNYNNNNINNNVHVQKINNQIPKRNNYFQKINVANITFTPGLNEIKFSDYNIGKVSIQINGHQNKKKEKEIEKKINDNNKNSGDSDNLDDIADDLIKAFDLENNDSESNSNQISFNSDLQTLKEDLINKKQKIISNFNDNKVINVINEINYIKENKGEKINQSLNKSKDIIENSDSKNIIEDSNDKKDDKNNEENLNNENNNNKNENNNNNNNNNSENKSEINEEIENNEKEENENEEKEGNEFEEKEKDNNNIENDEENEFIKENILKDNEKENQNKINEENINNKSDNNLITDEKFNTLETNKDYHLEKIKIEEKFNTIENIDNDKNLLNLKTNKIKNEKNSNSLNNSKILKTNKKLEIINDGKELRNKSLNSSREIRLNKEGNNNKNNPYPKNKNNNIKANNNNIKNNNNQKEKKDNSLNKKLK